MNLSHSSNMDSENKIYIYDDLLNNDSSIKTYTSEEENSENCSNNDLHTPNAKNKEERVVQDHPLYTIYEGGSSVSSGTQ